MASNGKYPLLLKHSIFHGNDHTLRYAHAFGASTPDMDKFGQQPRIPQSIWNTSQVVVRTPAEARNTLAEDVATNSGAA